MGADVMTEAIFLGGLGLVVGSFLSLLSVRLPLGEQVVAGRSRCRDCGQVLGPLQMIPVLSWFIQRGRCAQCRAPVSWRYPAIEAAAAAIGIWAALHHGSQSDGALIPAFFTALLGWQLLLLAIVDAEHFWLPDALTLPLAVTGIGFALWSPTPDVTAALLGMIVGFGGLWLIGAAYARLRGRQGLGGGDPIMFGAGGAWVGWMGLPSVLLWASAAGLSLVLAILIMRRRISGEDRLPFGTLLAVGFWLTWLYGPLGV